MDNKKKMLLLIPYVCRLPFSCEVQSALQKYLTVPIYYSQLKKGLGMPEVKERVRRQRRSWFFSFILFYNPCFVLYLVHLTLGCRVVPFFGLSHVKTNKQTNPISVVSCRLFLDVALRQKPEQANSSHQAY